jgi:putative MATE family efflux protein
MTDLTEGSIPRHIASMAVFITMGMVFQTLYFLVDLYFVASLGRAALAGVSSAGTATFLVMAMGQVIGVGGLSLIARAAGAKNWAHANLVFNQALGLALVIGAVMLVFGYLAVETAMSGIGADQATADAGRHYLYAYLPALAAQFPTAALGAALRGVGVVQAPTLIQVGSLGLNILLAPILIAGWGTGMPLGVAGAGLASTIAAWVGLIATIVLFARMQRQLHIHPREIVPDMGVWSKIAGIGLPSAGEFFVMFTVMGGTYWVIRQFGPDAQAGFGLGSRMMQAILMPAMAISFATAPIAGQNFGAKRGDRVRATFYWSACLGALIMGVILIACQLIPEMMFRPFTDDPHVIDVAVQYFHVISLNYPATGLIMTCSGMFQALGNTRLAFLSSLSRIITFMLPATYLSTVEGIELHHIWVLSVASTYLQAVIIFVLLRREMRLRLGGLDLISAPAT